MVSRGAVFLGRCGAPSGELSASVREKRQPEFLYHTVLCSMLYYTIPYYTIPYYIMI